MKLLVLLSVASTLSLLSGCSLMIANCGKDLSVLDDREQVRKEFGKPVASGVEDGKTYEDFRTHWKVVDFTETACLGMGLAMTFGFGEFLAFPHEVYRALHATIAGQDVRFYYDDSGTVVKCVLNGEFMFDNTDWRRRDRFPTPQPSPNSITGQVDAKTPSNPDPYAKLGLVDPDAPR